MKKVVDRGTDFWYDKVTLLKFGRRNLKTSAKAGVELIIAKTELVSVGPLTRTLLKEIPLKMFGEKMMEPCMATPKYLKVRLMKLSN